MILLRCAECRESLRFTAEESEGALSVLTVEAHICPTVDTLPEGLKPASTSDVSLEAAAIASTRPIDKEALISLKKYPCRCVCTICESTETRDLHVGCAFNCGY